ncbi:hypothetical protein BU14_0142s0006 [Porphyra umbilicalis]|uniref:Cytidyltransferase-like domain-containing protein n=1 Tax=Porphyra umbilicalis TaxID=2786 RepID=A0A1X6PA35_PORUM|nr:hypothetical protein BU14_0142s0006 [Porphyra umbilicalis]|eukprot:OSX77595.1 hypothetical protein BU14_0142s0006 [Porphyra umbilicalis]
MDPPLRAAVAALHASPTRAVLHVTGGGGAALAWLLTVPGCSGTLLDATIPYAPTALAAALAASPPAGDAGAAPPPASAASAATARALAAAAYRRAVALAPPGSDVVGVGATAALVAAAPRRGDHRVYVAARSRSGVAAYGLTLAKGAGRGRVGEDEVASRLVLQALVDAGGGGGTPGALGRVALVRPALRAGDELHVPAVFGQPDVLAALLSSADDDGVGGGRGGAGEEVDGESPERVRLVQFAKGVGGVVADVGATGATLVLPGSFNPQHRGHRELLAVASKMRPGRTPAYELSATNVDKPPLPPPPSARASAPSSTPPPPGPPPPVVLVTAAPLFAHKATLLPGTTFVIGADTAVRLVDRKYYGGSEAALVASLAAVAARGCDFLVAARWDAGGGRLATAADVVLPGGGRGGPLRACLRPCPSTPFVPTCRRPRSGRGGGGGGGGRRPLSAAAAERGRGGR